MNAWHQLLPSTSHTWAAPQHTICVFDQSCLTSACTVCCALSQVRTSSGTFFDNGYDDTISAIEERVAQVTMIPKGVIPWYLSHSLQVGCTLITFVMNACLPNQQHHRAWGLFMLTHMQCNKFGGNFLVLQGLFSM